MSFANPAMRGMRMLFSIGFDRVWFALAVIICLFLAGWVSEIMLQWLMIEPAPVRGTPAF